MRAASVLFTVLGLGWPWDAAAQAQPRARLVVTRGQGAEDCPSAERLIARARAVAPGQSLQTESDAAVDTWVYIQLRHDLDRYEATIQLQGRRHGARSLSDVGPTCDSLADAVSLSLALFLDADQPRAVAPTGAPLLANRATTSSPSEWRYAAALGGGLAVKVLPAPAPYVDVGVDVGLTNRLRLGLGGMFVLPQRSHVAGGATDVRLSASFVRGCARLVSGDSMELGWCLQSLMGVLSGNGLGYEQTFVRNLLWTALGGGLRVDGSLGAPAFWSWSANAVVPFTRRGFAVTVGNETLDTVTIPRFGAATSLDLGVWL